MLFVITRAGAEDLPEAARLDALLDAEMRLFLPDFFNPGAEAHGYEGLTDGTKGFILIARAAGRAVGMAKVAFGPVAVLQSLVVEEEYRGSGVGSALLKEARTEAKARGWEAMVIHVLSGNDRARALYEGAGFGEFRASLIARL